MLAKSVGAGIGYVFTLFFVTIKEEHNIEETRNEILSLCIVAAVLFTIISFFCIVLFKESPPIPPT